MKVSIFLISFPRRRGTTAAEIGIISASGLSYVLFWHLKVFCADLKSSKIENRIFPGNKGGYCPTRARGFFVLTDLLNYRLECGTRSREGEVAIDTRRSDPSSVAQSHYLLGKRFFILSHSHYDNFPRDAGADVWMSTKAGKAISDAGTWGEGLKGDSRPL